MRTGKDRVQVEATNVPVNIGDARVQPGDIRARRRGRRGGDPQGARGQGAATPAEEIEEAENAIREAVRGGMRLDEARKQFKYHSCRHG